MYRAGNSEIKRVEFLKKRYEDLIDGLTFNRLITLDPSKKKIHCQWIINLYKSGELLKEDEYKVTEYLNDFIVKKSLMKQRDILQFKTLPSLAQALDQPCFSGKISDDENVLIDDRYYIDNKMAEVFAVLSKEYHSFGGACDEGIKVEYFNMWGIVDETGEEVVPVMYESVGDIENNVANVKIANRWAIYNIKSKVTRISVCEANAVDKICLDNFFESDSLVI